VRAPVLEIPPLPPELLTPCPLPEPIPDGSLQTLYLQIYRDAERWGACLRLHDQLIAVVRYRDEAMRAIQSQLSSPKPWWQLW
jgi:hypothetical protein